MNFLIIINIINCEFGTSLDPILLRLNDDRPMKLRSDESMYMLASELLSLTGGKERLDSSDSSAFRICVQYKFLIENLV